MTEEPRKFMLEIILGNDVMRTADDVVEALDGVTSKLEEGMLGATIVDVNGNTVGFYELEPELCRYQLMDPAPPPAGQTAAPAPTHRTRRYCR